ncbi:inner membrane OXA1L-like [Octopus vulgaris]|uniref:Inner membrane OXA1L-like n=2 Tax=Octopus vulgaris TaxID=6645 RepID=A0AA36ATD4_OCTVU|nr:inner membrane OXA1L-like [Octopus vulgaris]
MRRKCDLLYNIMATCMGHVRLFDITRRISRTVWTQKMNISMLASREYTVASLNHLCIGRSSLNKFSLRRPHIALASPSLFNSTDAVNQAAPATTDSLTSSLPAGYIPEPPPLPLPPVETLNALGEPTFTSLGLASWTPSGLVQSALETLHVSVGLPWWGSIVLGTIIVRMCMFPIVVMAQRNSTNMSNHMPTIMRLQQNFSDARLSGNPVEATLAGNELMEYMKRNQVKPFRNFLVPLAQMPVFLSVFIGLRGMCNLPVESLTTGGILWFTDLSLVDSYYALPLLTVTTFLATIELGVDGVKAGTMSHTMKWAFRLMPVVLFPIISGFPSAMLCYWFTSNTFSLIQVLFLKIPSIRSYLNIPVLVKHDQSGIRKKGFIEGFRESWNNAKTAAEMEERTKVDALKFKEAGMGPIQKTYAYNPKAISAKSADKRK